MITEVPNAAVRSVKIDLITGEWNPIVEWFRNYWKRLRVEKMVYCGNESAVFYKTYGSKKHWVIMHNIANDVYLFDNKYYWYIIKYKFSLSDDEVKEITTILFDQILERKAIVERMDWN